MTDSPKMPSGGGSYRRDKNGNLSTVEEPTAPAEEIPASAPLFGETPPAAAPAAPPKSAEKEV